MAQTPNYNLFLTDDNTMSFLDWREEINGRGDSNMRKIDTALGGKADKSRSIQVTLTVNGWIGKSQSVDVDGIRSRNNGIIFLANGATDEQSNAAADARIDVQSVSDGSITVVARGEIPTVDIPATILLID